MYTCIKLAAFLAFFSSVTFCAEKVLFDFENSSEITRWTNADVTEPSVAVDSSVLHATSGTHSMRLAFSGGHMPYIKTTVLPDVFYKSGSDASPSCTFLADVYVNSACMVSFKFYQDSSVGTYGWDDLFSRWEWYASLDSGANHLETGMWLPPALGNLKSIEIGLYEPNNPETLYIDNIKMQDTPPTVQKTYRFGVLQYPSSQATALYPALTTPVRILGNTTGYGSVMTIATTMESKWKKPPVDLPVLQVESSFRNLYDSLKATNPNAVLAVFREGDSLYDPAAPSKIYHGWMNTHVNGHSPMTLYGQQTLKSFRSLPYGTMELFMRHRSGLFRVDVSNIKNRSTILAAKLSVIRSGIADTSAATSSMQSNSVYKPTFWWVDPCHRAWTDTTANVFRCTRKSYWKETSGRC